MFEDFYSGKRVLVTGHTGFKGAWLSSWLLQLGAEVSGLSLEPDTTPSLFLQLDLEHRCESYIGDIRDGENVKRLIQKIQPDVIFHLAAQPLVRRSYRESAETFATNLLGTVHLLEALKTLKKRCSVVMVTSDKCYKNSEDGVSYSEGDRLGGHDPYSASKACAELAIESYRNSFFIGSIAEEFGGNPGIHLASARAGNVIGGGDWSEDRLIPDCIRALSRKEPIEIRSPGSTRPWQHVLEPLGGYLILAKRLYEDRRFATAFNFGPESESNQSVQVLVDELLKHLNGTWRDMSSSSQLHEAKLLNVSIERAREMLGWSPVWNLQETIRRTAQWYAAASAENPDTPSDVVRELVRRDITKYQELLFAALPQNTEIQHQDIPCQSSVS